jgi:hypothetical protein
VKGDCMQLYDYNEVGVITQRKPRDMYISYFEFMVKKKKYLKLIPFAISEYGISPRLRELPECFKSVSYDRNINGEAETVYNTNIHLHIGPSAFKCPSRLATTLVHEITHIRQALLLNEFDISHDFTKRGTPQHAMDEVLAYFMEYQAKDNTNISKKERKSVFKEFLYWQKELKKLSPRAFKEWEKNGNFVVFERNDKLV